VSVSRGVSQPERLNEEPADLFSEEAAGTTAKSNGVHSDDDDDDLFAGVDTFSVGSKQKSMLYCYAHWSREKNQNQTSCEIVCLNLVLC